MRVVTHPADEGACGCYRVEWPARALAAQGRNVTVSRDTTYQAQWVDRANGAHIIGLDETVDADVVVIQRPLHRNRVELIAALQAQGVAVVVEIDDDFHAVHPRNPAWKGTNPLHDADRNRDWLLKACRRADLVTVTTPALARRYGEHGRVAVLPNYVPAWYTQPFDALERPKGTLLGWSGTVQTHPTDLQATGGVIARVLDETGARFHVVGTGIKVGDILDVATTATGWLSLEGYPAGMKSLDVGIVPLAPTAFNEAKSALKGLEFAAVGVPFVASSTGPYRALALAGVGWTASTPEEWRTLTTELLADPVHREALSIAWQAEIARAHTIEANAWRWWEAWGQAMENAQRREAA